MKALSNSYYIKARALNAQEKQRLRISICSEVGLKQRLNKSFNDGFQTKEQHALVTQLINLCHDPLPNIHYDLIDWLLTFGRHQLIAAFMDSLSQIDSEHVTLKTIKHANPTHFLPGEYISPDFQRIQLVPKPKTALICLTGGALRLNVPVQLFHFLAANYFDLIFYLRDFSRQAFTTGIPTIAENINDLAKILSAQIPSDCHLAVLGTSSGGYAAAALSELIPMNRLAMFSPPFLFNTNPYPPTNNPYRLSADNVRLYFALQNGRDVRHAISWSNTPYLSSIRYLNTTSHGTLKDLFLKGQMNALLDWLVDNS